MSTPIKNQIVANSPAAEKVKAPRKPTLSAKYSKFLVGNYSMIQMLSAKGLLTDEAVETAYSEIKLFDNIEDQTAFYEASIEGSKATSKAMKKMVTQRLKPPKAPRAKKAKKEVDPNAQPKVKKPRTKKETKVAKDTEQDVVAQLVEAANAPMTPIGSPPAVPVEPPVVAKKARKPRAKKVDVVASATEVAPVALVFDEDNEEEAAPAPKATKEKKPRAKKVKADIPVPAPVAAPVENESEDEEIHTTEITIGNKTFLIDNENNVYSIDTHDQVGTFNAELNEVVAC
jgi:hypothetical protein